MSWVTAPLFDGEGNWVTAPLFAESELDTVDPVLLLPADLYVDIPAGIGILNKDHPSVAQWLAAATAIDNVGVVALVNDCPNQMLLITSPVLVTFTAVDGAGNQASETRRIHIQVSSAPPTIGGGGQMFRYVNGRHVYIGPSTEDLSHLIDT